MDRITDYRTDMYSFGLTMYEAFTGIYPFADKEGFEDLIYAHLTQKMADPRTKNPNIPNQIVTIIEKVCISLIFWSKSINFLISYISSLFKRTQLIDISSFLLLNLT